MDQIDRIRSFNRDYTRRIGLLNATLNHTDRTFTELRILRDIGAGRGTVTARQISRDLGLDEGYVSRVIGRFVDKGLVERVPDPSDARRRLLTITRAGDAELAPLLKAARNTVADSIAHLGSDQRAALIAAMERIERLLDAGPNAAPGLAPDHILVREIREGDATWIVQSHLDYYGEVEGFCDDFEAFMLRLMADYLQERDPDRECGWIATGPDGTRLGCVLCLRETDELARLRILLVTPAAHGLGAGRLLAETCLGYARSCGYRGMTLMTHAAQEKARRLYAQLGFGKTSERNMLSFGIEARVENWEIRF